MHTLITELERATEGNRELDCAIYLARGGRLGRELRNTDGSYIATEGDEAVPHYTTSMDSAETVVPEGSEYGVGRYRNGRGWAWVSAHGKRPAYEAATPVLALTIAALAGG